MMGKCEQHSHTQRAPWHPVGVHRTAYHLHVVLYVWLHATVCTKSFRGMCLSVESRPSSLQSKCVQTCDCRLQCKSALLTALSAQYVAVSRAMPCRTPPRISSLTRLTNCMGA